jgi:arabinose-5-phosphate isomerase
MSALLDALTIALMELKGFSKNDYAKFHHGGYLGSKARGDWSGT